MGNFTVYINEELRRQKQMRDFCEKVLAVVPNGYLKVRKRKGGIVFYEGETGCNKESLLTGKEDRIRELFRKKIYRTMMCRAEKNIKILEFMGKEYLPNDYVDIAGNLSGAYLSSAKLLGAEKSLDLKEGKPVQHCFDPEKHIHETLCGLRVRSKSEVIIINSLLNYGIPVDYERKFPYPDERGVYFRPDFTFDLPDGRVLIWEHLGMLRNLEYSEHIGRKLATYQKYGYLIGRNLILTQDDEMGNCSSLFIDEVIRKKLLPYFR